MPHNRIRIWVGLAIAAVTIPAVALYAANSRGREFQQPAVGSSVRWTAGGTPVVNPGRLVVRTNRDYQGELDALLGRSATQYSTEQAAYADPLADDNPIFDITPYDWPINEVPDPTGTARRDLPDSAMEMAPVDPEPVAAEDDSPIYDETAPEPAMSDREVYTMVVDNLQPDDRDAFVRTWAVMTPDQRADLLDEFRSKIEPQN